MYVIKLSRIDLAYDIINPKMSDLAAKRTRLLELLKSYESCAVAFSAGIDSTVVAKAAQVALGDKAIAVTGVAGPGGGSAEKPVGTVWIAVASADQLEAQCHQFEGDRAAVREATLVAGLAMLIERVGDS